MEHAKQHLGQDEEQHVEHHNREIGRRGECAAACYLEMLDYEILDRNWECPAGEADIVALDGHCLVFCEVKTRTSLAKGFPCEAVGKKKRHRYELISAWYLHYHDYVEIPVRFDVIDLLVVSKDRALIRHIKDAFGVF